MDEQRRGGLDSGKRKKEQKNRQENARKEKALQEKAIRDKQAEKARQDKRKRDKKAVSGEANNAARPWAGDSANQFRRLVGFLQVLYVCLVACHYAGYRSRRFTLGDPNRSMNLFNTLESIPAFLTGVVLFVRPPAAWCSADGFILLHFLITCRRFYPPAFLDYETVLSSCIS